VKKIVRKYRKLCVAEGVELLGIAPRKGHYALQFERGTIFGAGTPSDYRNMRNIRASIRRLHN
jgi:hypothetical protein